MNLEQVVNCEKFMIRENPKPFQDNLRLVHGLMLVRSVQMCGIEIAMEQQISTR